MGAGEDVVQEGHVLDVKFRKRDGCKVTYWNIENTEDTGDDYMVNIKGFVNNFIKGDLIFT